MTIVRVYIDGFNVYHAIEQQGDPRLKWLNYWQLSQSLLRPGETLDAVHFFTAVWRFETTKQKRHENFIAALDAYGVQVHQGDFGKPKKWCATHERFCKFREEKQTDVGIAVRMLVDASGGQPQRMILVTADSDQIPTARALRQMDHISLTLAFPPGRAGEARELGELIPDRLELKPERLLTHQLPRSVHKDGRLVATMPAIYRR
ncbi:NYN domain-containing protein [Novosphingobium ginsenosidimutans]|uniref:NYN domain-containing protein n=1 Tax=Novosphingobium ginsenosidimutans TaxID=1176536 RepID=A0A5B8S7J8_9SPHN|nr:NYN domain-containing protein [Novosphingobium ginsenosidimutans]QEA16435.1 NYN domain-containing protein [Novosphingobium ginsenosidimutans]